MLATPVACAADRTGCANASTTSRAAATALLTLPVLSVVHPIRFMLLFLLAHEAGVNLSCTTLIYCRNLMLNAAFMRPHTVWDRPLRPRGMPAVSKRSSRRRRRLQSHRNSMTNLHGTERQVQLPVARSPSYASRSTASPPESAPLWCPCE